MIRLVSYSPYERIIYLTIKNLLQYDKNMKIIKVKGDTCSFVHFFLQNFRKINFKNISSLSWKDLLCVEFCVIILLHEWVDRGQMRQL